METFADIIRTRLGDPHEGLRFEGRSWSWDEVVHEACVRAALLRTISPRDGRVQRHVGLLMQNVPDFVFWILGTALAGDVVVGINPTRRGTELSQDIAHVDCDLLVTEPHYLGSALEGVELPFGDDRVFDVESASYAELLQAHADAALPDVAVDPASILLLLFSSGSTGAPKAVICSQGRLGRLTHAMVDRVSLHRNSVNYLCLPLFHGHAIMMNLATALDVGATIVMVRRFSASGFIDDIRTHRITFFNYVGRVLSYIVAKPPRNTDRDNALEVAFGSEAAPAEVEEFRERFGCEVREGYGASEGMVRIVPVEGAPRNSLGLPAAGAVVEIRDEENRECPRARFDENGLLLNAEEATGEMVVIGRGPAFEGYYKNPKAMAERLKFDGGDFWTGDLGYRDEDGYFYFGGRSSDWVRVDGENFGVAPVERILVRFPDFAGAHCYGVPDPVTGDLLMCAVTLSEGVDFDPERFGRFIDAQSDLGTKWRPTFVRVVDTVPLTGSGKINKAPLRAQAWEAERVWWAPTRTSPYQKLSEAQRQEIRDRFVVGGRQNALPAASRSLVS